MKKSVRFILLVLAALPVVLFAQKYSFNDAWGKAGFNLQDSKANGVEVVFSVPEFSIETAQINGENMQNIVFPTFFLFNDAGAPNLPAGGRYVAIPQGATPKLRITDSRVSIIENVNVAPAPVIPLDTDTNPMTYEKNPAIYGLNAYYPAEPVIISSIENIRGCDVVMLGISPFQYNPVTKQLKVYHDLKIAIDFEGGNGQFGDVAYRSRWWDPILSDALLNYTSLPVVDYNARMQQVTEGSDECEYIIISPSGLDFLRWADSIKIFRNEQGVLTKVFDVNTIGGNTTSAIESFLNNAYNTWTLKPAACLLLGDYGTDGMKNITSPIYDNYCASDNIYGDVNGDMMPDIVMARFTANNNDQLTTMLSKFLNYERNPPTDTFFYNHPITALGWQTERWFQICSETIGGFFKNELGKDPDRENAIYQGNPNSDPWSTATNTSTILGVFGPNGLGYIPATPQELGGWSGGSSTGINNAINSGAFLLQHRDHGMETGWGEPSYTNSNITALTNTNLVYVMSINCLTGKYNWSGECFVEKFHRHTKNGLNAGAVGLLGASETSYSFVNDTYVWGVYDNMWTDFMPAYGTTPESRGCLPAFGNAAGKYFLKQSNWPYNTGNKAVTYNLFHAHGDAFMPLYWDMPVALNVTHAAQLMAGATTFTVNANPGAFVALTVDNNIIGTGQVGLSGSIDITIPGQTVGSTMVVTVTKQNYFRYRAEVPVITEQLTADFNASQTLLCQGASTNFTDQSYGNPVSWSWSFEGGNPATSTDQNPQGITYATPGAYNVSLTVTDASSNQNTVNKTAFINTYDYPVAMFAVDGLCQGSATQFTDASTGMSVSSWNWDFGDGNTSTEQNPSHTYAAAGSYTVTLTVNNVASCNDDHTATVDILNLPMVPADPATTELACQGKQTVFTTAGGTYATEYAWELLPVGAGTVSGNTASASVTWDAAYTGPASIKVKSLNECGESDFSGEFDVTVQPVPTMPGQPAGDAQIDSYKHPSSDFTTTGADHATSYEWTVDPANAGTFTGTGLTGTITWDPAYRGTVNIHVAGVNDCGHGTVSDPFEVEIFSTMSINDLNSPLAMEIFPNPSKGKFTFSIQTKDNLSVNIRVLNPLGTVIFTEQNIPVNGKLTKVVDLSQESDGIYFVILENSEKNIIRKIMIQK